jgi:hypothetical protein
MELLLLMDSRASAMATWRGPINAFGHPTIPRRAIPYPLIKIPFKKFPLEIRKKIHEYELYNRAFDTDSL